MCCADRLYLVRSVCFVIPDSCKIEGADASSSTGASGAVTPLKSKIDQLRKPLYLLVFMVKPSARLFWYGSIVYKHQTRIKKWSHLKL